MSYNAIASEAYRWNLDRSVRCPKFGYTYGDERIDPGGG